LSVDATFEVIRFQIAPAAGDVAVVELEGRPADAAVLDGRVVLLLEHPAGHLELHPVAEADGARDDLLRATFAAPLEVAADPATTYALATGRGPVVVLPAPDGVGDVGLEVRLARTVNALRGELGDARRRLGGIVGNVRGELAAERESAGAARQEAEQAAAAERSRLEGELADVRSELEEARTEAAGLRAELEGAQARISELEATLIVPRAPRVPRGPRQHPTHPPRPPRQPRRSDDTEEREPVRQVHASLGRSTARTAMLIVLALVLVIIVVVVLQVRVLN